MHLLEVVGRVVLIYVFCLVLLRLSGRRELAQLGPLDLLVMLLLSETVSPALTGNESGIDVGLTAAGTLVLLYTATGWLTFRNRTADRLIQGEAVVLIEEGHVKANVLRRYRITDDDLDAALHDQGLLRVSEVRRAYVEADGQITLIPARATHAA